jgi:inner membrane protein
MDLLTHALSGVLVALAVEPARPRPGFVRRPVRLAAGAAAGVFPDLAWLAAWGNPLAMLSDGASWTHSLLIAPLWALLLAFVFAVIARRPREWPMFLTITGAAFAVHIGLDLMTATGVQLAYPLSEARFAVPLLYPIDLLVLTGLVVAAVVAWRRPLAARWTAIGAFAALAAYTVALGHWRDQALAVGEQMAQKRGFSGHSVQAFPQPFAPWYWQVLVAHADAFEIAWVALDGGTAQAQPPVAAGAAELAPAAPLRSALGAVYAGYQPAQAARWESSFRFGEDRTRAEFARTGWSQPEFERFRRFSVYTVLSYVEYRAETRQVCAWFYDARFALPNVAPSYRFGACQHMDERTWTLQRAPGPFPFH